MRTALTIAGSDSSGGAGDSGRYKNDDYKWRICHECNYSTDCPEYDWRNRDYGGDSRIFRRTDG